MSIKLMQTVWTLKLTATESTVLGHLADHANDDGLSHPSVGLIAWKSNLSERTVQMALRTLQDKKVIEPLGRAFGGRGYTTRYQLHLERGTPKTPYREKGEDSAPFREKGEDTAPFMPPVKGATGALKGAIYDIKGEAAAPEPSLTVKNLKTTTTARTAVAAATASENGSQKNEMIEFPAKGFLLADDTTAIRSSSHGSPNGPSGAPISSPQPYEAAIGAATWTAITADFARLSPNLSPSWLRSTLTEAPGGLQREALLHALELGFRQLEETARSSAVAPPDRQIRNWPRFGRTKLLAAIEEVIRGG